MEYSANGIFEDRPSQTFWYREQPVPEFKVTQTESSLKISTRFFHLNYQKEAPFARDTLSVKMITDSISGSGIWRFGFTEHNNRKGTARTLDGINGELKLERGLFSEEGYMIWDDQPKQVFENGWIAPRTEGNQDLYFFAYGDDFKAGIQDFYKVSGQTPMLPRYALGNWWSRYWAYNEQELKDLINGFEARNIPLSVCIIDMDWHVTDMDKKYGSGWTGYTWNNELFPQPEATLEWLKQRNIYNSLNLHPALGIRGHEACYQEFGQYMQVDTAAEEPIEFDFTNPKFVDGYFKYVHHPHEHKGVDFWWIDWQQGENTGIEKLDPLWLLNHYHFLDLARDGSKRGFTFSRYADLGSHRYPVGFSGDTHVTWESLNFQPYFTSQAAFAGYGWWSHDIGGHFFGSEDPELYTRWVQFGVFSPIMRLHTSKNFYNKREPWRWPEHNQNVVSDYLRLRHRLIPYIYTMAKRNHDYGLPLITPMMTHHPEHSYWLTHNAQNQYYFGSELIVAPHTTAQDNELQRTIDKVWLPEGIWFDFFTGERYQGGREYTLYSTLEQTPVFAKAGAIVPLAELSEANLSANPSQLTLRVFPGNGEFTLYEDDGISNDYLQGNSVSTTIRTRIKEDQLEVDIDAPQGQLNLIPSDREYAIEVMGYANSMVKKAKGTSKHSITLKLGEMHRYDPIQQVMDVLEHAAIPTQHKAEIGFVYQAYRGEQGGVLGSEASLVRKARDINQLDIASNVKQLVIDLLLKHCE